MNFLKKRSKKLATTFSNNNSTEENNKLNKPSQSAAYPTIRSDDSSIDQASLDLLAPTPPFASTSLLTTHKVQHALDKPRQSKRKVAHTS